MYLVQLLLPTADNDGRPFDEQLLANVQKTLAEKFGGVTAHLRAPAKGVWSHRGRHDFDDIVTVEVMTAELDKAWWRDFRAQLEHTLRQEEIVVRVQTIERI